MSEWHPIESAPKDGSWILGSDDSEGVCIVQYLDGDWYQERDDTPLLELTHWMPLPELPK